MVESRSVPVYSRIHDTSIVRIARLCYCWIQLAETQPIIRHRARVVNGYDSNPPGMRYHMVSAA